MRETDPDKLQARIEEAEQAMRQALRSAVEYELTFPFGKER